MRLVRLLQTLDGLVPSDLVSGLSTVQPVVDCDITALPGRLILLKLLKLRPEALYAFLYPVRTRQGPNRL